MKEIVVLSGKGGTGKTSLMAAFAAMLPAAVFVDCDVDAANLHLLLSPVVKEQHEFTGPGQARIDPSVCEGCGQCSEQCRFGAIEIDGKAKVNLLRCEGCGVCMRHCATGAITVVPQFSGNWYISTTEFGPMFHARLKPGAENSGKLVSILRNSARAAARQRGLRWVLMDGPPGTGCPAISALTGSDYALLVTEPSLSGFEDLKRVAALADHFNIPAGIIVNKADINRTIAGQIESYAVSTGRDCLGMIDFDRAFTQAQLAGAPVLAAAGTKLRRTLERTWRAVEAAVEGRRSSIDLLK